jgi:hypothetical protein
MPVGGLFVAGALALVAVTGADASASVATAGSLRSPACTVLAPPKDHVSFAGRGYRRVELMRSWLRVRGSLGVGHGPSIGGCTNPPPCLLTPSGSIVCPPPPPPPPVIPGPAFAVHRLRAFSPDVALSQGGSSRVILIAEHLCQRAPTERALLRCLHAQGQAR